jgi:hypothetical protein
LQDFKEKYSLDEVQQEDFCLNPLGLDLAKTLRTRKYLCLCDTIMTAPIGDCLRGRFTIRETGKMVLF